MKRKLVNCSIIDCTGPHIIENGTIIVDGNSIAALVPNDAIPSNHEQFEGEIIDMQSWTVLPGLMDMHFHLSSVPPWRETYKIKHSPIPVITVAAAKRSMEHLQAGVTSLRVIGEIGHIDIALRDVFDTNMLLGPRLFVAGKGITSTGGHGYLSGAFVEADGAEEFRKIARQQLRAGADFIKIISTGGIGGKSRGVMSVQLAPEEIRAAAEVAHQADRHVAAHAAGPEGVIASVENGVDCIEHGYVLNDKAIQTMVDNHTILSPTLTVTYAWTEDHMRKNNYEEWVIQRVKEAARTHLSSFRHAAEAGIMVVPGSDELPSDYFDGAPAVIKDIEIMSQNGLSNMDAIQAGTINGAKLCRVDDKLGTLEPGKLADLIAVEGNPLEDIIALRNLRFVMKDGTVVPLDRDLFTQPETQRT